MLRTRLLAIISLVMMWAPAAMAGTIARPLELYEYDPTALHFKVTQLTTQADFTVYRVSFHSQVPSKYPENQTVTCTYYQPAATEPVSAVVVLHVYRTVKADMANELARHLARRGLASLVMPLPYHLGRTPHGYESGELLLTPDPQQLLQTVRQALVDVRCAVHFLASRPHIAPHTIGCVGLSLGGVVALLASQIEPRLSAVVAVAGAGSLTDIIWGSGLTHQLKQTLKHQGITYDRLADDLAPVDIAALAGHNPNCAILMINSLHDWFVPKSAVLKTWHALGKPPIIWLNSGHLTTFAVRGSLFAEVSRFLNDALITGQSYTPHRLPAINLKLGFLDSEYDGPSLAAMVEILPLDSKGHLATEVGLTFDGGFGGTSYRITENLSVGIGSRIRRAKFQLQPYWMLHITF